MFFNTQHEDNFNITSVFTEGLINNLFVGICVVDTNKIIKFWCKGAESITGYKMPEVKGQNFFNKIKLFNENNEYLMSFQSPVTIALEKNIFLDERLFLLSPEGEKICIRLQATPAVNEQNEVFGEMILFVKDAAYFEQKQLTEELKELNKKKNQFLGMAAHDLRNPLHIIKGFTSLFLNIEKDSLKPEHLSMLELIDKNCKQMLTIVNDLVDISAIAEGKIDLNKQLTNIKELLDTNNYFANIMASKKNIIIEVNIQNDIPQINIDKDRITQVIENLLTNAVKFSHPQTTINLKAFQDNNYLNFSIKDQGKGIPKEDLELIFKPFETPVKPTGKEKSTGLGLVIVKNIIDLHQGKIVVYSEPGKGTEFIIKLPINN